jgi:hypothetical protein
MTERMHYFTGRHLAARDFSDEQLYHRTHRYLHNRMLHGWGVVCGFNVTEHKQPDCRTKFVQVSPGMALDCCGHEIVVDCAICCGDEQPEIPWKDYRESHPWLLLCLCYQERGTENVPVLHSEGDCSNEKDRTKHGRYREGWELCWRWISKSDLHKYNWNPLYSCQTEPTLAEPPAPPLTEQEQTKGGRSRAPATLQQAGERALARVTTVEPGKGPSAHQHPEIPPEIECPHDDCGDPCSDEFVSCVHPGCPPQHCVPLALICVQKDQPVTNDQIFTKGRPQLPYVPQRLTRVARINWPHGGLVAPCWFEEHESLRVTFDRKLHKSPKRQYDYEHPLGWGVNEATFVVQFGEQYEDLDFVLYEEPPRLLDDQLTAEYKFDPRQTKRGRYSHLEGHTIWVTLKCDFLYDCHSVRVDGNNDGIAGGVFESWFTVVSDEDYERCRREERL